MMQKILLPHYFRSSKNVLKKQEKISLHWNLGRDIILLKFKAEAFTCEFDQNP